MCLFAEMKVQSQRVLEEMNDKVPEHDEQGRVQGRQAKALRKHLDESSSKHES